MNSCPITPKTCKPAALLFDHDLLSPSSESIPWQDQMQRDRWLYQHYQPGDPPLLRFYQWPTPTLSIGRFQDCPENLQQLALEQDFVVLRRPSGGQAIWHQNDLTFSWIGPPIGNSVLEGHTQLKQAISRGLEKLGIFTDQSHNRQASQANAFNSRPEFHCFHTVSTIDLQVAQGKLVGSAQARCRKALLQQSTLYLAPDRQRYLHVFGEAFQGVGLRELGLQASLNQIIAALSAGFAETLGLAFVSLPSFDDYATFAQLNAEQNSADS